MNFPHQFHVSSSISVLQGLGTIVQTILQSIPGKFWVTYFEIKYYDSTSRVIILVILVKKSSFVADNISNSFLHWPFIVTSGILLPSFLDLNRFLEADLGFCAGEGQSPGEKWWRQRTILQKILKNRMKPRKFWILIGWRMPKAFL